MVKSYYDRFKSFLKRAAGSISVAFVCLTGVMGFNMDAITVHADTANPTAKQSFITWLMSYFGINIYTEAQAINETLYSAVEVAYNTYQLSLQSNQQVPFDKLFDGITVTPSDPNVLKISGWVFNTLKGFATWINTTQEAVGEQGYVIGDFEYSEPGSYFEVNTADILLIEQYYNSNVGYTYYTRMQDLNGTGRLVCLSTPTNIYLYYITLTNHNIKGVQDVNINSSLSTRYVSQDEYNNNTYYYNGFNAVYKGSHLHDFYSIAPVIEVESASTDLAYRYAYGDLIGSDEVTLNDVFALPEPSVLDDLIGAADPEDEVEIDLDGSDINVSILSNLQDLIDQVAGLVDSYVVDNSYPETIGKVIAQSVAIDNELTEVDYPNALTWEVPELINTPQIIPLITPECPDLSACLVSGIQDVGQTLGNVIESNANVSNYVSVILFMGIALTILGGI